MIKKQTKKVIVTLCLVASLFNSIIPLQASMTLLYKDAPAVEEVAVEESNSEIVIEPGQEVIKIENKDFELFLTAIVDAATQSGNRAMLSEALLHCYDSLKDNQKMYYLKDLQEAMPEFMEIIELYSQGHKTDKAPRPGILAPAGENEIVGPGACDLSAVTGLLHQILTALNKCCAILQRDFRETWTILAEITNEINGTFTVLADLKATISSDFNQTWTILDDIKSTITECCANITREFQETWTILDAGFNSTFSLIVDLKATVSSDFNQTWTILNDIKSTITECCANITQEFQETWTILADIKNTITECCANITIEFQETWTIINAGFNGTFSAIAEINTDAAGTFSVLQEIIDTLTECCANITLEFQETWTILGAGFNDTFSSLVEINTTLTECCANITNEFQATWTILGSGFNGTFSSLVEINNTLTECCANITREFQETWTILGSLSSACVSVQITQGLIDAAGGTYVIDTPGNYVLAEDITGGPVVIDVDASNVTIDLCNRSISGNGDTTTIGILIEAGASNINIVNGAISNMLTNGIQIADDVDGLLISNIRVDSCGGSGIILSGATSGIRNAVIENCLVETSATGAAAQGGLNIVNASNIEVKSGQYNNNGSSLVTIVGSGIFMSNVRDCMLSNVTMNNNNGIAAAGLIISVGTNNVVDSCIGNDNVASGGTGAGFIASAGFNNTIMNCEASFNNGDAGYGFVLNAGIIRSVIKGCTARQNFGTTPFAIPNQIFSAGIFVDGASGANFNEVLNNLVVANDQAGIFDNNITFDGTPAVTAGASQTLVSGNSAVENGNTGPAFATDIFKNYLVAYAGATPVQFTSLRYSTGAYVVSVPAGATMISNIDARNA